MYKTRNLKKRGDTVFLKTQPFNGKNDVKIMRKLVHIIENVKMKRNPKKDFTKA